MDSWWAAGTSSSVSHPDSDTWTRTRRTQGREGSAVPTTCSMCRLHCMYSSGCPCSHRLTMTTARTCCFESFAFQSLPRPDCRAFAHWRPIHSGYYRPPRPHCNSCSRSLVDVGGLPSSMYSLAAVCYYCFLCCYYEQSRCYSTFWPLWAVESSSHSPNQTPSKCCRAWCGWFIWLDLFALIYCDCWFASLPVNVLMWSETLPRLGALDVSNRWKLFPLSLFNAFAHWTTSFYLIKHMVSHGVWKALCSSLLCICVYLSLQRENNEKWDEGRRGGGKCLRVINYLPLNNKLRRGNESGSTKSFQLRAFESFFRSSHVLPLRGLVRDLRYLTFPLHNHSLIICCLIMLLMMFKHPQKQNQRKSPEGLIHPWPHYR